MFGFYPRSHPIHAPLYYQNDYAPQTTYYGAPPAAFLGSPEHSRKHAMQAARRRAAQQDPFGLSPKRPSSYEQQADPKLQAYLRAKMYEDEFNRRQQLEAQARMQHGRLQQPHHAPQQDEPESELDSSETEPSPSAPDTHDALFKDSTLSNAAPSQEQLNQAALTIQKAWRRYLAIRAILSLESGFTSLTTSFTFPSTLDFTLSPGALPVSLPDSSFETEIPPSMAKLAYTKNNAPLHAHVEALSQLLVKLDGVESHGDKKIRDRRKAAICAVEKEAEALELRWRALWARHGIKYANADEDEDEETQDSSSDEEFFEVQDMLVDGHVPAMVSETEPGKRRVYEPDVPVLLTT